MTQIAVRVIDCHVFRRHDDFLEFLMLRRALDRIYPGIWQCVTGKIEADEKPVETAIRELKEETGLDAVNVWSVEQVSHYYEAVEDRMNLIPVFGIEVGFHPVALSDEHTDFRWCPVTEAMDLIFWESQGSGMKKLHQMILNNPAKTALTRIPIPAE